MGDGGKGKPKIVDGSSGGDTLILANSVAEGVANVD